MIIQQVIFALVVTCLPQNHINEVCYVLPDGNEYSMTLTDKPEIDTLIPILVTTIDDRVAETLYMVVE